MVRHFLQESEIIMPKQLFISTPISAFNTNDDYLKFRAWLAHLITKLENTVPLLQIFCVAAKVKTQNALDSPKDSLLHDISKLDWCSDFLLIYPKQVATSALIELGYALAKEKKILICHISSVELPFMASQMDEILQNVTKITFKKFDDTAIDQIIENFKK